MRSKIKIELRDITFLAILSVVLILASGLVMPLVMTTQFFALRQLCGAIFFAPFTVVALYRVPKIGALTVIGLFTGFILLFMSPVMFVNNVLGAILTEIVIYLIYRGYRTKSAKHCAAILYMPMTLPITFLYNALVFHRSTMEQFGGNVWLIIAFIAGVFFIAWIGTWLGEKIAQELQKAGKLPK